MKLITELMENISCITESREDGKKNLYIEGVFMQYDTPNRNGRIYNRSIMEREVSRYVDEVVSQKRAYGELNHPSGPQINLDRVCHIIEKLELRSNGEVIGKARVVETPKGNIVKGLLEGGANLGVSSRGMGSLKEGKGGIMEVQQDFRLVTAADVVADPSAPRAYINGIMENVDWVFNESNGEWVQQTQKQIRSLSKSQLEEQQLNLFKNFLKTL
jgi:hypothetical protein